MPTRLVDLLRQVPHEVEAKVKRIRDHARSALQDALRAECRLVMRTPEEAEANRPGAQVPVDVAPGHPAILNGVIFPDDLERMLLLARHRRDLEQVNAGARGLLILRQKLMERPNPEQWVHATERELRSTADWAASLLECLNKHDPLKSVLAVREDFLGVYEYDTHAPLVSESSPNRAKITIYWAVVGLVADWMGCAAEDLAVVVLAHELAHAYTQLGADIDGRRWSPRHFAEAETELKEGLAQYYTERVLSRLERRFGGALRAYRTMLPHQPPAYQTHKEWTEDFSPEAVRRATLEVRRWNEGGLADFNRRLAAAQRELHPARTDT